MRFLVIGARGFVGGAVMRRLLRNGDDVHALVRSKSDLARLPNSVAGFLGDVRDPNTVAEAAKGCAVVVHAAGLTDGSVPEEELRWTHVAGTENVLHAARHAGCERLVLISTTDVTLGDTDRVHWNEDRRMPQPPVGAFAQSKQLAEDIALASSDKALEVVALRAAWLWGAGDHDRLATFCKPIFSDGFRLVGKGENLFDTTHIDNLAEAVLAASEASSVAGRAYHITDSEFRSSAAFLQDFSRSLGIPAPQPGPPIQLARATAWARTWLQKDPLALPEFLRWGRSTAVDTQRARTDLEWEPHVTHASGLEELADWVNTQGGIGTVVHSLLPFRPVRSRTATPTKRYG
ncbi:MAG: NAD(P)-dependent oxidoreductase [Myxococcales bacterium]|nr:NAD(P)-dependent oxidoreductase [Myxococcales bacterium]